MGLIITIYLVLCKVKLETLPWVFRTQGVWKHILVSVVMNWLVTTSLMVQSSQPIFLSLTIVAGN